MNEYYYIRYNLYKYFLNIDDDIYNYYLSFVIPILYILLILLSLLALLLLQNITGYTIIYIILLVFFYIITYKLIISLKSINTNDTLIKYKNFYELRNIIFKENLQYALNNKTQKNKDIEYLYSTKKKIINNINNTENIYGNDAKKLFNSSDELLKYFDLNEYIEKGYYNRLYIENINFIQTSIPYIIRVKSESKIITYIDLELLEDYPIQQRELLKYLNSKYNKKLSFTSKNIFTADFNKKLNNTISNYKKNIYYYIAISVCFIIILLHSLFVYFNNILASIYLTLIIIALIILYYFN
jgi:hypothetical protein